MSTFSTLLIVLLCVCLTAVLGALELEVEAKTNEKLSHYRNNQNQLVFQVWDHNSIIVPNGHRNGSSLKLSLGSSIVQVVQQNPTLWELQLADHSIVHLSVVSSPQNGNNPTTALNLVWLGGGPNGDNREICFHYGFGNTWYDTYQRKYAPTWPMNLTVNDQTKMPFNYLLDPKGESELFNVQELLFLNSDGFALLPDENQPLFMQRRAQQGSITGNQESTGLLCFSVNNTQPYYERTHVSSSYYDIKVHLYASSNIRSVLEYVHRVSPHIPKPSSPPSEEAFSRVSWNVDAEYPQSTILNLDYVGFTARLIEVGFRHGEVVRPHDSNAAIYVGYTDVIGLLNVSRVGDFVFKHIVRPTIMPVFHGNECDFLPSAQPSIYPDHLHNFIRGVETRSEEYSTTFSVDFSNPIAVGWYVRLQRELLLMYQGKIHSLFLDPFTSIEQKINLAEHDYQLNPNRLITKYVQTVVELPELKGTSVTTRVAYKSQHLPVVVQLWTDKFESGYLKVDHTLSSAEYLQALIGQAMTASIAGYSYFATNPIGTPSKGLTEELYIRWVQATSLMPHMTFYRTPWHFSPACVNITRNYVQLHSKYVPLMVRLADERVRTGAPIMRPMWYAEPDNRQVHGIVDQFMLGDQLVVAPVLKEGQRARKVYLPQGVWLDQHGKQFTGPGEVTVDAPLEVLPFFRAKII